MLKHKIMSLLIIPNNILIESNFFLLSKILIGIQSKDDGYTDIITVNNCNNISGFNLDIYYSACFAFRSFANP